MSGTGEEVRGGDRIGMKELAQDHQGLLHRRGPNDTLTPRDLSFNYSIE
jgi:hypothetical protein